jgi:glucose-1-phosphate thymidylyltransferase
MIKKGIILAGGKGTRMSPLTKAVNKQLLPIYDKPLIFYPLSILMLANIKDVLIVVNKGQLNQYKKLIPVDNNLGIKISYVEQESPNGLPEAFCLVKNLLVKAMLHSYLGIIFFMLNLYQLLLSSCVKLKKGAKILLHKVNKPERYGVAKIKNNKIVNLKEKPKKFYSDLAITGLYFFDNDVVKYTKNLKPSKRGELEITDLLKKYLNKNKLKAEFLGRGGAWLDTGSIDDFYKTSSFVSAIENRQGFKIACLEEISLNKGWINKNDILNAIKFYGNCQYSTYLKNLI